MTRTGLQSPRRRSLLLTAAGGVALGLAPAMRALGGARSPVVVLTSYRDEVVSQIEAGFNAAHPEYRLQFIWRMPHDALPYLLKPGQSGVDVYWSASPRSFARLADAGVLKPLPENLRRLPARIGHTQLADPQGRYVATEMAGYGFAYNAALLKTLGVAIPADWKDLCNPRLAGRIALPIPARVGFAPVMVDMVLQAYGWDAGWAVWSEIAGLAKWVGNGNTFVSDEVGSGACAVGLSIDFFVASAIASGADLGFQYPQHGGINPGQIACTANGPNPHGAIAFADFVLSSAGQRILMHPDVRKLPVDPAAYADAPAGYFDPFAAARRGGLDFDSLRGQHRLNLIAALFQQLYVEPQAAHAELWQRIHRAQAHGKDTAQARAALCAAPLTEAAADKLAQSFQAGVERQVGASEPIARKPVEQTWFEFAARQRQQAAAALSRISA